MTTPTAPASDEEIKRIAAWNCDCAYQDGKDRHHKDCMMIFGPRLLARLDQSEAILKDMAGLLERVREYVRDNDDEELQALDSVLTRFESMTKGGKRG